MRKWFALLILLLASNQAIAESIVQDNFNSYTNGSIVGQGGWQSFTSYGDRFTVQDNVAFEGIKALHCNSASDNVIVKIGTPLQYGTQVFYLKTENRESWAPGSKVEFRLMDGPGWPPNGLCRVEFNQDSTVNFLWGSGTEISFATFNDNEWTRLEMEWRVNDSKARYRVNDENWTDWYVGYTPTFTSFDRVGIEFQLNGGSGGVYVDALGVPEPSIEVMIFVLLAVLIICNFITVYRRVK